MICLTFDTDYMREDDMNRFLDEYQFPGAGTFFVHENTLGNIDWKLHEVCPHPTFDSSCANFSCLDKFDGKLNQIPLGMRSHSCVTSHMLGIELKKRGFKYASNQSALYQNDITPMRLPWGVWELPIYYMDSMDFTMKEGWPGLRHSPFSADVVINAVEGKGLYVFDFHPLHISLNTSDRQDYAKIKDALLSENKSPFDLAFSGKGTRTFFEFLLDKMKASNISSRKCIDVISSGIIPSPLCDP